MVLVAAKLVGAFSSAAYSLVKDTVSYFKDKAKYIRDLEQNLTDLTAEMITLYSRKEQIDRDLTRSVSKEKSGEYNSFLKQVEVFTDEYNKFTTKYGKYCGNLPIVTDASTASSAIDALPKRKPTITTHNFFNLAKLSKQVKKLHDRISHVTDRINQENMSHEKKPEQVQGRDVDIDIPSLRVYVDQVVDYLQQDRVRIIGVVGAIGVGKTTVMEMLNNQLQYSNSLKPEIVIWIDYPQQPDPKDNIEMVQDVIIGRLKLILGEAGSCKANIISTELRNKKYILIIDQVSSPIDLHKVGIHKGHKFGKVVVASSSNKYIMQLTDKHVQIQLLSDEDAVNLFYEVCGKIHDQRIKNLADQIIKLCGGLPLVIKLVAEYLKGKGTEEEWNNVKRKLQSDVTSKQLKLGGVGNAYKLVYDGLDECYMKKCLLWGALFPNGYKIYKDYLVECWMAEGFLDSTDDSYAQELRRLRRARDEGAMVLRELTDRFLLERCWDKYVKMPVYFRTIALQQQYPGEENCKIWVPKKSKHLDDKIWSETTRMSLICCNPELPETPRSKMSTFLLQGNRDLRIEERFFEDMQNLRVLDLCKTDITSLPRSVSSLVELVSLYLNDCSSLYSLSRVQMLIKLEVLDIRGTSICELPNEIGSMHNLRCLRASLGQNVCYHKSKGKQVKLTTPVDIIRYLKHLEELAIETGCCNKEWDNIVDELTCLEKLTTLVIHFLSVSSLERFIRNSMSWRNTETDWEESTFRSFRFSVGCCEIQKPYGSNDSGLLAERQLRLFTYEENNRKESSPSSNKISLVKEETSPVDQVLICEEIRKENSPLNNEISSVKEETSPVDQVLRQASAFELVGQSHVKILSQEFDLINAGSLKVCTVGSCKIMTQIVDSTLIKETAGGLLQCLEMLHLYDLELLESIWKGTVCHESLACLKVITLSGCPKLTEILNSELAIVLSSLEHLKVENCSEIQEIIKIETSQEIMHADLSDTLPKLETIELADLPNLESICNSNSKKWKSLRKIVVTRCGKLKILHLSGMEKLEQIRCEICWWRDLEESDEMKKNFSDHCDFIKIEQSLTNGAYHEGESSSNGKSDQTHLPSENNDSPSYNRVNGFKDVKPNNQDSTSLPASNIDAQGPSTAEERCWEGKVKIEETGLQAVAI